MANSVLLVKLREVWREINEHPYAVYFRDMTSTNDQPIADLSSIKRNLDNQDYVDLNDFVDHMMTIFDNARTIALDDSLCIAATTLERLMIDALSRRDLLPSKTRSKFHPKLYLEDEFGVPLFTNFIFEEEELDNELLEIEEQIIRIEDHKRVAQPISPPIIPYTSLPLPDDSLFSDLDPDFRLPGLWESKTVELIRAENSPNSPDKSSDEEFSTSSPALSPLMPVSPFSEPTPTSTVSKKRKLAIKCGGKSIDPPKQEDSISIVYSITHIGEESKPAESCTLEEFEFDIHSKTKLRKRILEKYIDKCIADANKASSPSKRSRSTNKQSSTPKRKKTNTKKTKLYYHNSPTISYQGEVLHLTKEIHEDIEVDICG